jgi:hypothetical protein
MRPISRRRLLIGGLSLAFVGAAAKPTVTVHKTPT